MYRMHTFLMERIIKKLKYISEIWFILIFVIILVGLVDATFFSTDNILNVIRQFSVKGILSLGILLVILVGEIDLSTSSVLCFAGLIAASFQKAGLSVPYSILMSVGFGALIGFFNGVLVVKRNIPSFIVTLAVGIILRGYAMIYSKGEPAIVGLKNSFLIIGQGSILGIPFPFLLFLVFVIIIQFILTKTSFGIKVYATGSNIIAAKFSGIKVDQIKILVFTIMGMISAISGLVLTARLGAANSKMGEGYELDAIAAVIIGGVLFSGGEGSLAKIIPGIIILGILPNVLNIFEISPYFQYHIRGIIIILAYILNTRKLHFKKYKK